METWKKSWQHGQGHGNMDKNMTTWMRTWKHGRGYGNMIDDMETWSRTWKHGRGHGNMDKDRKWKTEAKAFSLIFLPFAHHAALPFPPVLAALVHWA
jgi:hypothetical protein